MPGTTTAMVLTQFIVDKSIKANVSLKVIVY